MSRIPVFCFSHAGGMSYAYRDFVSLNQSEMIEFIPIEISGHGRRMREKLYFVFDDIVEDLFNIVCTKLGEQRQFMLMGHSMGAWIAYEIAKRFQSLGISPLLLILSSNVPAKYYSSQVTIEAGDEITKKQLVEQNHEMKRILEDEILCDTFYPIIKADYISIGNYIKLNRETTKLSCNVLSILSNGDKFDANTMSKWKEYIEGDYIQKVIIGDHFAFYKEHCFLKKQIEQYLINIKED